MILAQCWAVGAMQQEQVQQVHFHADDMSAFMSAQSLWNVDGEENLISLNSTVHEILKCNVDIMRDNLKPASLEYHHVKSHDWQPWNEMADSVAKWARFNKGSALPRFLTDTLLAGPLHGWEWLKTASWKDKVAYPEIREGIFYS